MSSRENAARLCDANDAQIYRVEGDVRRKVASYGNIPVDLAVGETRSLSRGSVSGRAVLDRQIVHMQDMMAERKELCRRLADRRADGDSDIARGAATA